MRNSSTIVAPMTNLTESIAGGSAMSRIDKHARSYTELRGKIAAIIDELNENIDLLTQEKMPLINELVANAAAQHAELEAAITAAPQLFQKPRTMTLHGLKCGFRKSEGRIEFDDPDTVVKRIHQMFDAPEPFLRIVTQPNKQALSTLPDIDLKRLGCRVVDPADVVVIKSADNDIEKKVNALFKVARELVEN
jgi:phage host-nuclease inhibitor protein Gam